MTAETTVLDEDLDLSVRTENNLVVMTGYSGDDGTWEFTADEARDLALALLDHADRLDDERDTRIMGTPGGAR